MNYYHIKANLTYSEESYQSGNGEGVWVIVDEETKEACDNDVTGAGRDCNLNDDGTIFIPYECILDNDSVYYDGLEHGERLPLEMRGDVRPVVPYAYLCQRWKLIR